MNVFVVGANINREPCVHVDKYKFIATSIKCHIVDMVLGNTFGMAHYSKTLLFFGIVNISQYLNFCRITLDASQMAGGKLKAVMLGDEISLSIDNTASKTTRNTIIPLAQAFGRC